MEKYSIRKFALGLVLVLYPILPVYFRLGSKLMMYYIPVIFAMFLFATSKLVLPKMLNKLYALYIGLSILLFCVHFEIFELIKFVIAPIGLLLVMITFINTEKKFLRAIDLLIYTAGIVCIFGIIEAVTTCNVFGYLNNIEASYNVSGYRMGILRIQQSFGMPTNYCNYLVIISVLVFYRMQTLQKRRKSIYTVIWWLVFINAFCTGSRAPLIVLIIAQVVLVFKTGKQERWRRIGSTVAIVLVALVAGAFLGLPIFEYIKNYFYVFLSLIDSSYQAKLTIDFGTNLEVSEHRVLLYKWIYDAVRSKIFFGIGVEEAKTFTIVVSQWLTKTSIENEYLTTLLVYGIVGLFAELQIILANIIFAFKRMKTKLHFERIGFNFVFVITMIGYALNLFTVSIQADQRIVYVFFGLMIVYNFRFTARTAEARKVEV